MTARAAGEGSPGPRVALVVSPDAGPGVDAGALAGRLAAAGARPQAFQREELHRAAAFGPDRVAVAGGDGSVGPAAELAARLDVPLAVIPTGTANNFATAEALPRDVDEACRLAAGGERTRAVDLGRAGHLPFVNLASAGLAPVAAERAARLKRVLGPASYSVGAAAAALTSAPVACELSVAGERAFRGPVWQVMVALSGAFGPGVRVEGACASGGTLNAVVIPAGSRVQLLRRGWWIRRGRIATQPGTVRRRAPGLVLRVPPGTPWNVDGEVVPLGPVAFSVEPAALRLLVP